MGIYVTEKLVPFVTFLVLSMGQYSTLPVLIFFAFLVHVTFDLYSQIDMLRPSVSQQRSSPYWYYSSSPTSISVPRGATPLS